MMEEDRAIELEQSLADLFTYVPVCAEPFAGTTTHEYVYDLPAATPACRGDADRGTA